MKEKAAAALVRFFGTDVKRTAHALKVAAWAETLGALEALDPPALETLVLAALFHDLGIKIAEDRYGSCTFRQQEELGPPAAAELLRELAAPEAAVDRVCFLVAHHHSPDASEDRDFRILIEADFLVNLEEENLPRQQVREIGSRHFRTAAGLSFLAMMFGYAP
ncbi:MAG: HD domain-containing protein [Treponema sp.]|jgi:hypothetical protein|nr:HD domain-containing protein [Treponema sp.]